MSVELNLDGLKLTNFHVNRIMKIWGEPLSHPNILQGNFWWMGDGWKWDEIWMKIRNADSPKVCKRTLEKAHLYPSSKKDSSYKGKREWNEFSFDNSGRILYTSNWAKSEQD